MGTQTTTFADIVFAWQVEGRITHDERYALIEESRRREQYDPYEGTYLDGAPADVWDTFAYLRGRRVWVVNAYELTRQYGGPEEGGWWQTVAAPVRIAAGPFFDVEDAKEVAEHLQAFANVSEREGNMYSVLGGYQTEMRVESCIPHDPVLSGYC